MPQETPKRAWYRVALPITLGIALLLALLGICFWYEASEWIKQRDEALRNARTGAGLIVFQPLRDGPLAPWGLWLLGEKGVQDIYCDDEDAIKLKRLFPEAQVKPFPPGYEPAEPLQEFRWPTRYAPWTPQGPILGPGQRSAPRNAPMRRR